NPKLSQNPWWPGMTGSSKTPSVDSQMLKRPLHQPFAWPLRQTLRWDIRAMERRLAGLDVRSRRRAKALRVQVQELPHRQHVGGFAQAHGWRLAQGAGCPAEDAQHHHQPRYRPMLGPLLTETEHLAGLARVAMTVTAIGALDEGSIDMR